MGLSLLCDWSLEGYPKLHFNILFELVPTNHGKPLAFGPELALALSFCRLSSLLTYRRCYLVRTGSFCLTSMADSVVRYFCGQVVAIGRNDNTKCNVI